MNYIDKLLEDEVDQKEIIKLFYLCPISNKEKESYKEKLEDAMDRLIKILYEADIETIVDIIEENKEQIAKITPANIPQFSSIESINDVLDYVNSTGEVTYELIGYYIKKDSKKGAQTKYGENHYKTAALMGLVTSEKPFRMTTLGKKYRMLQTEKKKIIRNKLFLLVPIVQKIMIQAKYEVVHPLELLRLFLSESTSIRRRSNVRTMVEYICKDADMKFAIEIQNNLDWK